MMYKKNDMRERERERERERTDPINQSSKQASWPASSLSLMNILSLFSLLSVSLFCLCLNDPNKASSWQQEFVILCHKRSSYPASCEDHPMHGDDSDDEPIYFHEICMGQREALAELKSKLRVLCFAFFLPC